VIRGALVAAFASVLAIAAASPVHAAPLPLPDPVAPRSVSPYPNQMPAAGISGQYATPGGGFLTLPCLGDCHFVTSNFDHCGPTYAIDGVICRFDGTIAYAGNGRDPQASIGYAVTSGGHDYLYYDGHDGWDLGLYYEPVLAAADGTVTYSDWAVPGCYTCSFGQGVRIDHGNGFDTLYGHLWRLDVAKGQRVSRGQVIGISGTTGSATGEHLHFGVYHHGTWMPVDPFGWEGKGADPWSEDAGNLWLGGAARPPAITLPQVTAGASATGPDDSQIAVSWSSPGPGVTYDVSEYADDGASSQVLSATTATAAVVQGQPGHSYWFLVSARTALGEVDAGATPAVTIFGAGPPDR
jgi:murein DD-endopeptidase MepM/ murein hydrolase activator NlpD